ncbi:MAG: SusD/RagB family nutrient-binding outer membrane lipoprotein [Bacteroidales bacterium]|nr:SusD/RagB family nutrient-binding outer membrane lipoprotein [Bacteroidales bacterium]
MRIFIKTLLVIVSLSILLTSCEKMVEGINENPNKLVQADIDARLLLTGAQLANIVAQASHSNRITGMYSGQLIGFQSLYSNIYGYSLSTVESDQTWSRIYVGCIPNTRAIIEMVPDDKLMVGICKVMEAHAIGTAATLFGNVPYSEINNPDISDPVFDDQVSVFTAANTLLDAAIADLTGAESRGLDEDIHFLGDKDKWIAAAYTIKARNLLQMKNYTAAYTAAQSGISSYDDNYSFWPIGDAGITGDKNLYWTMITGSRDGDIGTGDSYMIQLLDAGSGISRNNAKTDEYARFHYSTIIEEPGANNIGIAWEFEAQELVSYEENTLILAECAARNTGLAAGLVHLNDLRAWLNTGGRLNAAFADSTYQYDAYVAADFANGGMENIDGIDGTRALLREIIEERYISGFGTFMPFNDVRRLRASDSDLVIPFPLNPGGTQQPERLPYSEEEINANENIDADPGLYTVTEVNQ